MKKIAVFLLIVLIHFTLSVAIIPVTLSVAEAEVLNAAQSVPTLGLRTLVTATRILHFPIISLSWYSRQWFPGDWIRIPMLINSFLWATGIYFLAIVCRKIRGKA